MKDLLEDEDYINDIFYKRYVLANSGDNGVWLCKNHHGMFDSHYYCFDTQFGKVIYKINISNTEKKDISSKMISDTIPDEIMTDKTKEFLNQRQKALEACNILFCY